MSVYLNVKARIGRELPMSEAEHGARVELAAAYRIFDMLGWTELIFNHITLRVPGPEVRFLINPFGLHYSEVKASNLVLIDLEGNALRDTDWPVNRAGWVIHSAIHGAATGAHCIKHTHTTNGVAVASLKDGLSPNNFYGAQLHGGVAYHEFEGITIEMGEKERLVRSIGNKRAVILRNHGLLTWGPSLPEAFLTLWTLQRACDVQLAAARAGGEINRLSPGVIERMLGESGPGEKRTYDDVFAAMLRLVEARDPSFRD